ncbi:MAG: SIS domain-containing protein [Sphingomonadales bacterium]|nr:SIS domain-containing protein [Sphingomonadales bacterium]
MTIEALQETSGSDWTGREIAQQPTVWEDLLSSIDAARPDLDAFITPLLAMPDLRIILAGAGSSAFIGRVVATELTRMLARPVEAIATTDIVAAPLQYLLPDRPTLLVSYGRSGDSPESLECVRLADQVLADCYHLTISCNADGALARFAVGKPRNFALLMPPAALDQSFAMTSSVSAMALASIDAFAPDRQAAAGAIAAARLHLAGNCADIDELIALKPRRFIFLGSGTMQGIATEAALKALELAGGVVDCYSDSPLGFRHGPKFLVDEQTVVVVLDSADSYTRNFDRDLADELVRDGRAKRVVRLGALPAVSGTNLGGDLWQGLIYLIWCQQLAYRLALSLGINPDNPCSNGQLNRVVKGVTFYPFDPTPRAGGTAE